MLWVLFSVAIVIAVYFATSFFLLKKAMKEANREFQDILKVLEIKFAGITNSHCSTNFREIIHSATKIGRAHV